MMLQIYMYILTFANSANAFCENLCEQKRLHSASLFLPQLARCFSSRLFPVKESYTLLSNYLTIGFRAVEKACMLQHPGVNLQYKTFKTKGL